MSKFLYPFSRMIWIDEIFTYLFSCEISKVFQDVHLPLYYFLNYLIIKTDFFSEFTSIKILSVLSSFFLYCFTLKKARDHNDDPKYLFLFIIFNMISVEWVLMREARMYELYYVVAVVMAYTFNELNKDSLKLYFLSLLAGLTHALMLPLIIAYSIKSYFIQKTLPMRNAMALIFLCGLPSILFYGLYGKMSQGIYANSWQQKTIGVDYFLDYGKLVLGDVYPFGYSDINNSLIIILFLLGLILISSFLVKKVITWKQIILSIPVIYLFQLFLFGYFVHLTRARFALAFFPALIFSLINIKKPNIQVVYVIMAILFVNNVVSLRYFSTDHQTPNILRSFEAIKVQDHEIKILCENFSKTYHLYQKYYKTNYKTCHDLEILENLKSGKYKKVYTYRYLTEWGPHALMKILKENYEVKLLTKDKWIHGIYTWDLKVSSESEEPK